MKHLLLAITFLFIAHRSVHGQQVVPLVDPSLERGGWGFSNGQEFPGATGSLAVDQATQDRGHATLRLAGDFTKGGNYVNLGRKIDRVEAKQITFRVKYPGRKQLGLQLNDGTGQTHQMRLALKMSEDWQEVILPLEEFFAKRGQADAVATVSHYETWGGAKDGRWHGPATGIYLIVNPEEQQKTPVLWVSEITILPPCDAYHETFETPLANSWQIHGDAKVTSEGGFKSKSSLLLTRNLSDIEKPCDARSPDIVVAPGTWELSASVRAELASPDNSYRGLVELVVEDKAGQEIKRYLVVEAFKQQDWKAQKSSVNMPAAAAKAHFVTRLDKASGSLWIDELTANRTALPSAHASVVTRMLFSTVQLGNLLLPTDSTQVKVSVLARRALQMEERSVTWTLRDYWGQWHTAPATITLAEGKHSGQDWLHEGSLEIPNGAAALGRYYEIHAAVKGASADEPFLHTTSLAILPEAAAKKFPALEIPFTSRNWDNRLTEYIRLTDRLGVRVCGLWGGWSMKPPYAPDLPGLDETKRLGLAWLTNTPAALIERGDQPLDETALQEGTKNFLAKFGTNRPFIVNLGNEPHGTGDKVTRNVAAYRTIYQTLKAVDPTIKVVATSVEPNEEYFKAGYGQWCDAFDFHIYESAADVRRTMKQYRALMKKYQVEKPLWSTELGLNSQGMTRQVVAGEVWRKTAAFFAEGGASMSWFGLLYPDQEGTSFGSAGDSHNLFDCRFNRYAPRLDAVAWYNVVNGLTVKKFAAERLYPSGVQATLFRDEHAAALLFLWSEQGVVDVTLPLPGAGKVTIIHIDGRRTELNADNRDLTLSIATDPLLLLFDSPNEKLPETLAPAQTTFTGLPESISGGQPIAVQCTGVIQPVPAPFWTTSKLDGNDWQWQPPATTPPREVEIIALLPNQRGELYRRVKVNPK